MNTRRSKSSGGFTLVELIVIIVIVAILAGAALPAMSDMSNTRSAMAGRQILRDMTYARQRAISTGLNAWVVCDVNAGTWSILSENRANPGRANAALIQDAATGSSFLRTLAADFPGVTFTACNFNGGSEVGFDWRGRPLRSNGTALTAQGSITLSGGHAVVVEVGSGHIRYVP